MPSDPGYQQHELDQSADQTLKQIHDRMRRNLDIRLIEALETPGVSAAIMTAAIKRIEQMEKELTSDPADDMADMIQRLKQEDRVVPDLDTESDDPATDDRR